MSSSNSTALTKRSAAGALMPPPPAPKLIKRPSVVLDEDTYVSAVSHIIRRDFFPGLAESDPEELVKGEVGVAKVEFNCRRERIKRVSVILVTADRRLPFPMLTLTKGLLLCLLF